MLVRKCMYEREREVARGKNASCGRGRSSKLKLERAELATPCCELLFRSLGR